MPFYEDLERIEGMLDSCLAIEDWGQGVILVNGVMVDTSTQVEMLTPTFFSASSADNPMIKTFMEFFQQNGILPRGTPAIPIIRDIPLRCRTAKTDAAEQQKLFASFLEKDILVNQWTNIFENEYRRMKHQIGALYNNPAFTQYKTTKVTLDAEGNALTSGGYDIVKQNISGINIDLRVPASHGIKDIEAAVEKTLNDTLNSQKIFMSLKSKLCGFQRIGFNVRGVSQGEFADIRGIQNADLGGGHQSFFLLDRSTKTMSFINDAVAAGDTRENVEFLKTQLDIFLTSIGDSNTYTLQILSGKSRQPEGSRILGQPCSISQFCHYAAVLSGVPVSEVRDTVPTKVTTLLYLLQYPGKTPELTGVLNALAARLGQNMVEQRTTLNPKLNAAAGGGAVASKPLENINQNSMVDKPDHNMANPLTPNLKQGASAEDGSAVASKLLKNINQNSISASFQLNCMMGLAVAGAAILCVAICAFPLVSIPILVVGAALLLTSAGMFAGQKPNDENDSLHNDQQCNHSPR